MLLKRNLRAEECRDRVSEWSCSSSEVNEWVVSDESVSGCCIASSSSMTMHDNFWFVQFMIRPWIFIFWFWFDLVLLISEQPSERKQDVLTAIDHSLSLSFRWVVGFCCDLETEVVCTVINRLAAFHVWPLDLLIFYSISRYLLTPYVLFYRTFFKEHLS